MPVVTSGRGFSEWKRPASDYELGRILDAVRAEVAEGGIGIGVLVGYDTDSGRAECFALAELAAQLGVPTFTHTWFISTEERGASLEGALEVNAAASGTGAHMHMCHLNSTSNRMIDTIAGAVENASSRAGRAQCVTLGPLALLEELEGRLFERATGNRVQVIAHGDRHKRDTE